MIPIIIINAWTSVNGLAWVQCFEHHATSALTITDNQLSPISLSLSFSPFTLGGMSV